MQVLRVASVALWAVILAFQQAAAQPLSRIDGPKELPPAGFAGKQYVDSTGCVFVRAGANGQISWIPRVDRNRKLVCGFEPSVRPIRAVQAESGTPKLPGSPASGTQKSAPQQLPVVSPGRATGTPAPENAQPAVQIVYARPLAADKTFCPQPPDIAHRYLLSDGRRVTRCGPGAGDPVAYLNGLEATNLTVNDAQPAKQQVKRALAADAGAYQVVWSKGKLAVDKSVSKPAAAKTATRAAEPQATTTGAVRSGPRYVQVGVYAEPGNADRAVATLKALGLKVSTAQGRSGQKPLRMVLAGPFESQNELAMALRLARQSGYGDAFIRP